MNEVRAFAMAAKSCFVSGSRLASNPASFGKPISGASFPAVETTAGNDGSRTPVRAVLLPGKPGPFVRLETVPSGGGEGRELFTTKLGYLPGLLKLLNPQTPLARLAAKTP